MIVNLLSDAVQMKRNEVLRFMKGLTGDKWTIRWEKNNRGDYGYNEHFFNNGIYSFTINMDGARIDPHFYKAKKK